jgi:hypothetical protein
MVTSIRHWNGRDSIRVAQSRGGVFAVISPWDNLVRTGITPWPPPEILQKLYESRHGTAFDLHPTDQETSSWTLGFYSDIQSLHSEDALTWSFFGPLVYGDGSGRRAFLDALLDELRLPRSLGNVHLWLWRRFPHPDTRGMGGPELDFGIQAEDVLVLGEAKWGSPVGTGQGVDGVKNQMQLRDQFLVSFGESLFPSCTRYVLLGLSRTGEMVPPGRLAIGSRVLDRCNLTWARLCQFPHPLAHEIREYLDWKLQHSKPFS